MLIMGGKNPDQPLLLIAGAGVFSNVVRARDAARDEKDVAIKVNVLVWHGCILSMFTFTNDSHLS